ncbi:DUF3899 domain-containing protein [Carnobacterium sp.]|uniref:DUF3899 domain-containing protein n=1 Tax=Carnobacterium sp. TaxID=48221 RepID=UPI003C74511C
MKLKISVLNLTSIIVILCLILELIIYKKISFFFTTNILFAVASFFLIISLFWSVLYSGAFDFFHFSMKKVTTRMRREDNSEEVENIPLSKSVGHGYKMPLKVGLLLLIISLVTLFFHYFF